MTDDQIDRCTEVVRRALDDAGLEDVKFCVYLQSDWTNSDGVTLPGEWTLEMRAPGHAGAISFDRPDLFADADYVFHWVSEAEFVFGVGP